MFGKTRIASVAIAAIAATALAAQAAEAAPQGWVTVAQCASLSGTITYRPGLAKKPHAMQETINATLAGCVGEGTPMNGTGTLFATLSSARASKTANNENGTFVINWPGGFFNPTSGSLATYGPTSGTYAAGGTDSLAGAFPGAALSASWIVTGQTLGGSTGNKVVSETFVNTQPLKIMENFG
jgi:hypothetical protein